MRVADPLLAQRKTLHDTEAMLFVDDGETQARQRHHVLEKRVSADGELRFAAGNRGQRLLTLP